MHFSPHDMFSINNFFLKYRKHFSQLFIRTLTSNTKLQRENHKQKNAETASSSHRDTKMKIWNFEALESITPCIDCEVFLQLLSNHKSDFYNVFFFLLFSKGFSYTCVLWGGGREIYWYLWNLPHSSMLFLSFAISFRPR